MLDLGVDGIMLMGSFIAFYVVFKTGNLWLGVGASIAVGILMGLLMAVVSVTLQAEQGISGIGLYLFGLGLSSLLFRTMIGSVEGITGFQVVRIPLLSDIPVLGEILLQPQHPGLPGLPDGAGDLGLLNKTTLGLKVGPWGRTRRWPSSSGIHVNRVRYFGVIFGAAMAGLAGAHVSTGLLFVWQENITNGLGFIAVALALLRRLASAGRALRLLALRHRQRVPALGSGQGHRYSLRPGCYAALRVDDHRAGLCFWSSSPAGCAGQALRAQRLIIVMRTDSPAQLTESLHASTSRSTDRPGLSVLKPSNFTQGETLMHRTVTLFVLLLIAVLALTGCGSAASTPAPAAPAEAPAEGLLRLPSRRGACRQRRALQDRFCAAQFGD